MERELGKYKIQAGLLWLSFVILYIKSFYWFIKAVNFPPLVEIGSKNVHLKNSAYRSSKVLKHPLASSRRKAFTFQSNLVICLSEIILWSVSWRNSLIPPGIILEIQPNVYWDSQAQAKARLSELLHPPPLSLDGEMLMAMDKRI